MNTIRVTVRGLILVGWLVCGQCSGQEPDESPSTEHLRREVAELRATVAELTKRLEAFEYQTIPRAEITNPPLTESSPAAQSYVLPLAQSDRFPVEVQYSMPKVATAPQRTVPHYLRFPEAVERAMLGPF